MLTDLKVRNLKPRDKPYKVSDGKNRYVVVLPSGTRSLRWKFKENGKQQTYTSGVYGDLTLAEWRDDVEVQRKLRKSGINPNAKKKGDKAASRVQGENTLEKVATAYHARIAPTFRNPKHSEQWLSSLRLHVFARLGGTAIATMNANDLLSILEPLAETRSETALRVRQRIEAILDDARMRGMTDRNVATEIKRRLRRKKNVEHLASLPYPQVRQFIQNLRQFERTSEVTKTALEFLVLTAARTAEVMGARWSEIDWQGEQWVIPAARMKAGREHRVPLGPRTQELLEATSQYSDTYCFPSINDPNRPMSTMSFLMVLRRLETGRTKLNGQPENYSEICTIHGFRSSFATWSREQTHAKDGVIETALAHGDPNKVRQAYDRSVYEKERRDLALVWERFCTSPVEQSNVVQIKRAR